MKPLKLFAAVLCCCAVFAACTKPLPNQLYTPLPDRPATSASTPEADIGTLVQVGDEYFGYLQIPASWQASTGANGQLVFTSGDGSLTCMLDYSGISGQLSASVWADEIMAEMQAAGSSDYVNSTITFLGYDGYQCYGSLPGNMLWVSNVFTTEDGQVRCLSMRGAASGFFGFFDAIAESFTLTPQAPPS